jgi:hypothetical protein
MRGTGGHHPAMATYQIDQDGFVYWAKVVLPCVVLSFPLCQGYTGSYYVWWSWWMQLCWTFSILLEAVAVLPQVIMFRNHRELQSRTGGIFILLVGLYRFLYILNYIYRALTEPKYNRHIRLEHICAAVQAIVAFGGFFWPPLLPPANHEAEEEEEATAAALQWPQLIRAMVEDIWNPTSAVFFGFALVLPTALMAVQIVTYGTLASEIAAILLVLWLIVAIVLVFQSMLPTSTDKSSCCCSSRSRHDVLAQDSADPHSLTVPLVELSSEERVDDVANGTSCIAVDSDGVVPVHEEESSKNVLQNA